MQWKPPFCEICQRVGHQCQPKVKKKWQPRKTIMPEVEQEKEIPETENKDTKMELKTPKWIDFRSSGPSRGKQTEIANTIITCQNGFNALRFGVPGGAGESIT